MPEPSIKSRPVYGTLQPRARLPAPLRGGWRGRVGDPRSRGQGAAGVLPQSAYHLYFRLCSRETFGEALRALRPDSFYDGPSIAAALPRLAQALSTARMGTRVYLAGTEGLIGQAMRLALEAGIDHAAIETEHRGSLKRRVQCVHCKGITENVTTQPAVCAHCGLHLFVRDHYSRRIAAFQGVCIDAEEPGVLPETEELYR